MEKYEKPLMEMLELDEADVVVTSCGANKDTSPDCHSPEVVDKNIGGCT